MIIGTLTLLSVLLFGGAHDVFFIDRLEQGIKRALADDKLRKKELLAELKEAKARNKAFRKSRQQEIKTYKEMNLSREISREEIESFFRKQMDERVEFQREMVEIRLSVLERITDDEWAQVLENAGESFDKQEAKAAEKAAKHPDRRKEFLDKTRAAIVESVMDEARRTALLDAVQEMIDAHAVLIDELNSINVRDSEVLVKREVTREELEALAGAVNGIRQRAFETLVDLHFTVLENTDEAEWQAVMPVFNKELRITDR